SPALGDLLAEWGVMNVVHNDLGVDTTIFSPLPDDRTAVRAELGIDPVRTVLLYVGRLAQEKNTQTLFEAFRLLPPGKFHLVIVGDGLQRAELEQLRQEPSLQKAITWLPYCGEAARLAQLYRAADLFVHPGVQETFGLVTLEAQACGTPVIGIRGSYMDRIIHSDQTLWARENSAGPLAAAIDETSREDLKRSGAAASGEVVSLYSWEQVFTRLFDLYRDVVENYRRP
ncbi:MAG TPA: glycosyltransferase, partial [Chthoniobacteraceae bacterium]